MAEESFSYSGNELDGMAEATNYYRWIINYFGPFIRARVIEVGAGVGTFCDLLLSLSTVCELTALEPAENLFPELARRFAGNAKVQCIKGSLHDYLPSGNVDNVVAVNVLEHIKDDVEFLHKAHRILAPDGTILLFTPALPRLYGTLDRRFGHCRRYTKRGLANKLLAAGFYIEFLRYFNLPGVFTWFLAGRVLRRDTIRPSDVRLYDRCVVPWASKIERWWEPPFGQSLLAVGRKPNRSV